MATTNPSIARAYVGSQDLFTITYPEASLKQTNIASVSKADPAVVTVSSTTTISATGTVGTIAGADPYTATITGMTTTQGILVGQKITATDGVGSLGDGEVHVTSIVGNTSITIITEGGSTPVAGSITAIKIPATLSLPVGLIEGDAILINNVAGMTQLATAGIDGTNKFTVANVTNGSFELAGVDSSGFSTATANTGTFEQFNVPQYNSVGSTVQVVFDESGPEYGSDISVDTTTGIISVEGGLVYTFTATAEINVPGATYQWYEVTNAPDISPLGESAPVGTTLITAWTPADPGDVALIVTAAEGTTFSYPAQITNAQAIAQVASGFVA